MIRRCRKYTGWSRAEDEVDIADIAWKHDETGEIVAVTETYTESLEGFYWEVWSMEDEDDLRQDVEVFSTRESAEWFARDKVQK